MSQGWLQVIGLMLDLVGVTLIAVEWMLAQRSERILLDIAEREARAAEMRGHLGRASESNPMMQRHLGAVADLERRRAAQASSASRQDYNRRRFGAVYVGLGFVLLGFILQIMGTWPGCCEALGIAPGP